MDRFVQCGRALARITNPSPNEDHTMMNAREDWKAAYRWQRKTRGAFVTPDSVQICEHLRRLFAEPYLIRGRMASGRPATMLNHRWRDMRPIRGTSGNQQRCGIYSQITYPLSTGRLGLTNCVSPTM